MSVNNLINTLPQDLTNLVITPRIGALTEEFIETEQPDTGQSVGTIFVSDGSDGLTQNGLYYRPQNNGTAINLGTGGVSPFDPRFSVQNRLMVKKNPGLGEFLTVSAALSSLTIPPLPSTTNRYEIWIGPGIYSEPQLTVPPFVYLVGMEQNAVILSPQVLNLPFISFQENSGASFFTINGSNTAGFVAIDLLNNAEFTLFHKMSIYNSYIGIRVRTTTNITSETYLEYIDVNDSAFRSVQCTSTAGAPQSNYIEAEDFFIISDVISPPIAIEVTGAGTTFDTIGADLDGLGATVGISITEGATTRLMATSLSGFSTAVDNPNVGAGCRIFTSNSYFDSNVLNINIQNPATIGNDDGFTEYTKTRINFSSTFFVTEKQKQTITVSKSGGDFNDIAAAIASIGVITPAASATLVYIIIVYPGIYTNLATITIPPWVTIRGIARNTVTVVGPGPSGPTFEGAANSSIEQVTISNPSGTCIRYRGDPSGGFGIFSVLNVRYDNSARFFTGDNTNGISITFMLGAVISQTFLPVEGFILTSCQLYIETAFLQVIGGALTDMFRLSGAGTSVGINNSTVRVVVGAPNGTFCRVTNNARVRINNFVAEGLVTGVTVPIDATNPVINIVDMTLTNCTTDVSIANPNCTGNVYIIAAKNKVSITPSISNISVIIQDPTPTDASFTFNGRFFYGETFPNITNFSSRLVECGPTGLIEGGVPTAGVGLSVTVAPGKGYVMRGTVPNEHPAFVEWLVTLGPVPLSPNINNFIYIDQLGVLAAATTRPNPYLNIFIAEAITDTSSVLFLVSDSMFIKNVASRTLENLNQGLAVVYKSGSQGAIVGLDQVNITSGVFYYGSSPAFTPAGQAPATLYRIFSLITPGDIRFDTTTNVVPTVFYNDLALGIIPIPAGQFTAHTIYAAYNSDTATTRYFLRYGQSVFPTQTQAEGYMVGAGFTETIPPIFSVVVEQATASIVKIVDRRPYLSTVNAAAQPAVLQHSALLGLTVGNDHPQYLLRDGTQPMTGALDMGGFAISNAGTYNGVTVEAHASRHVPGGADPLPTAAPVTIGTVNAIGAAASFARSDHVHAHGNQTVATLHAAATTSSNGFMSSTDKTKLDASTSVNTASTLMQRDASGFVQIREVDYMTNLNLNQVAMRAPNAIGSNWTFTLPPDPGTSGFALVTNGAGVTSWSGALPPDPMTTAYDIIYRDASNTTSRLGVGEFGTALRALNNQYTSGGGTPAPALFYETIPNAPCREWNIFDDFSGGNTASSSTLNFDHTWQITVVNGGAFTAITSITTPSATTVASQVDAVGCIGFNTSTATNSTVTFNKGFNIMTLLNGVLEMEFGFYLHTITTPPAGHTYRIILGMGNSAASTVPSAGVYLSFNSGAGQPFTLVTANGGTTNGNTVMLTEDNAYYVVNIVTNVAATQAVMNITRITNAGVKTTETVTVIGGAGMPNTATSRFGPIVWFTKSAGATASIGSFVIDFYRAKMTFTRRGRL